MYSGSLKKAHFFSSNLVSCLSRLIINKCELFKFFETKKTFILQKGGVLNAKALIREAIANIFDVNQFITSSKSCKIADLGCSVGPNTFNTVKHIIESIELEYQYHTHKSDELNFKCSLMAMF